MKTMKRFVLLEDRIEVENPTPTHVVRDRRGAAVGCYPARIDAERAAGFLNRHGFAVHQPYTVERYVPRRSAA